jgi:hypothetical protein
LPTGERGSIVGRYDWGARWIGGLRGCFVRHRPVNLIRVMPAEES